MKGILAIGVALTLASIVFAAPVPRSQSFTSEQVRTGAAIYERNCSPCHGARMADPESAFDLRTFPRDQHSRFVESVTKGKNSMPPWGDSLKPEEVEALWAYVLSASPAAGASTAPAKEGLATPTNVSAAEAALAPAVAAQNDTQALVQNAKTVPPFRIFDNLYYVGIDWVSAYVLKTSDGLILIDTLYGPFTEHALASIRQLGFDPKDIKYALVTHAHFDHAGGAKAVQAASGARVGMTGADWTMIEQEAKFGRLNYEPAHRDLVIRDGDTLRLGDTTLKFYVTPGHTPGVLSMEFPVRDGASTYKAFMFGGVGLNFEGVERTEMYIASVRRLMTIPEVQVNIPNHPLAAQVFERASQLASRKPGDPHPFVAPGDWKAWLQSLLENAQKKLDDEKRIR